MNERFFRHANAICEAPDDQIGQGTRIWAFAHVLPGARIGSDCNICDGVFVENDVVVGNRVTVKCGVQLWDGLKIEDDVFIGPNATFTNDRFPRSRVYPEEFPKTILRRGCSIGANSTILPGLEIGANAMVGAGSVVTRSVPSNAIVVGNPARITGYVDSKPEKPLEITQSSVANLDDGPVELGVGSAFLRRLKMVKDLRGSLSACEFENDLPFTPKRYFTVFDVPSREVRGEHAHRECHQFLVCIRGTCHAMLDDGRNRTEVVLDQPDIGVFMPAMTWGTQYRYGSDAVLLVFASELYNPDDYIRTYEEFLQLALRHDRS